MGGAVPEWHRASARWQRLIIVERHRLPGGSDLHSGVASGFRPVGSVGLGQSHGAPGKGISSALVQNRIVLRSKSIHTGCCCRSPMPMIMSKPAGGALSAM